MLVILEGPEKVGKTTFAHDLKEWWFKHRDTDTFYVHRPRAVNDPVIVAADLKQAESLVDHLVIFDRFYPSDLVYRTWDGEASKFPLNAGAMEETFGQRLDTLGYRFLLTEDPKLLAERRTPDDIPIPPDLESRLYEVVCPPAWMRLNANFRRHGIWEDKWSRMVQAWEQKQQHRRGQLKDWREAALNV